MRTEKESLKRELIKFIVPSVAAQWVYALYTMVDGMFVARGVSETALTAVNLSFPVITSLFALSLTFAVGTSTMVTLIFNHVILLYLDQEALVSYTIVSYVNSLVVMSATGIAQGSQPLISYHHGMGDKESCKKLLRYELIAAGILCIGALALLFPAARLVVSLYISPPLPALRQASVKIFRIFISSFLLVGFNIAVSGYFTAVERASYALLISAGRGFVLMVGVLLLLARYLGGEMIWWTPLVTEGICLLLTCGLYRVYEGKGR